MPGPSSSEVVLQPLHQPRAPVDSGFGISSSATRHADGLRGLGDLLEAARHGGAAVRRAGPPTARRCASPSARNGTTDASPRLVIVSATAMLPPAFVARGNRQRLAPAAVHERRPWSARARRAGSVACSSSHSPSATAAARIVIVEVRPRGVDLHGFEAVRRRPRPGAPARGVRRETGAWRCRSGRSNLDFNPRPAR